MSDEPQQDTPWHVRAAIVGLRREMEQRLYQTGEERAARDNRLVAALLAVAHDDEKEWKGILSVMSDADLVDLIRVSERVAVTAKVWQGVRARQAIGDAGK